MRAVPAMQRQGRCARCASGLMSLGRLGQSEGPSTCISAWCDDKRLVQLERRKVTVIRLCLSLTALGGDQPSVLETAAGSFAWTWSVSRSFSTRLRQHCSSDREVHAPTDAFLRRRRPIFGVIEAPSWLPAWEPLAVPARVLRASERMSWDRARRSSGGGCGRSAVDGVQAVV